MRLPAAQRRVAGRRKVRLSLGTRDRHAAQVAALALAQCYAQNLSAAQGWGMSTLDEIIAQVSAAAAGGRLLEKYKISLPGLEIEANNRHERREVIDMLKALPRAPAPAVPAPPAQTLTLRDAVRRWESALPRELPAKTRSISCATPCVPWSKRSARRANCQASPGGMRRFGLRYSGARD
jgi:hypothetical protein